MDENLQTVLIAAVVAFLAAFIAALLTSGTVRKYGVIGALRHRFSPTAQHTSERRLSRF